MIPEYILCSAIHFKNGASTTVENIESGVIITGRRHSDCYNVLKGLFGNIEQFKLQQINTQGFLTSNNRFVDRTEAFIIAQKNKQILIEEYNTIDPFGMELISEHLY